MTWRKRVVLGLTHGVVGVLGFALGLYTLPILVAPPAPTVAEVENIAAQAHFIGDFKRDLQGSDALHWGEGRVSIADGAITFVGKLAPGPDYQLYLSPKFVETEADFNRLKATMVHVGGVKTFENFVVPLDSRIDPTQFNTLIVWCETFGQFITAAQYFAPGRPSGQ